MDNNDLPIVPGRGLNSNTAVELRLGYLKSLGFDISKISEHFFPLSDIRNNIESIIGSTEIPVGIVGPLKSIKDNELIYCAAGTLEGALVASMNRGAKAISKSGGFNSEFLYQRMVRAPLFLFNNADDAVQFKSWVDQNFDSIKQVAEQYSNHSQLMTINPFVIGNSVHLKFVFSTGDASGQNMTTTCTWHAMLWIVENFAQQTNIEIVHFVIEGNGASDKKVSQYSIQQGRGVSVTADCILEESVINSVLRTTSDEIVKFYTPSVAMSKIDGMVGYNINVANALAAIFVATGQDLGSLHESSVGILRVEKTETGLYLSLNLPNLVIGTVGGGTHLPKQKEALEIMGCLGNGKIERFARSIAGFALALEISTYAAIVSGEFAKAHEKLGRNKPVNWLLKSDINVEFIEGALLPKNSHFNIKEVEIIPDSMIENGILTDITRKVNKKLIGFLPVKISFDDKELSTTKQFLIKSKALDIDVIKGLHLMAASIDPELSDLIFKYRENLEYSHCHTKEILLYELLDQNGFEFLPEFFGKVIKPENETYLFIQEFLYYSDLQLYNTENNPEKWTAELIKKVIGCIDKVHKQFNDPAQKEKLASVIEFKPWTSKPLYKKMITLLQKESDDQETGQKYSRMLAFVDELEQEHDSLNLLKTLVHNDFNSRNIAIRNTGKPCIYDWELAVIDFPHRDVVELLSFVLNDNFTAEDLHQILKYHYELQHEQVQWSDWLKGYTYSLKEYLVTRVSFYAVSGILLKYGFTKRILENSFRMIEMLA